MKVYSIITENSYKFTSNEIFLKVFAKKPLAPLGDT
jgi:hypothetical protein